MNILVLAFDALHNGLLPPYGCTWRESAPLNRLAAESLVLDNFYSDKLFLPEIYNSLWKRSECDSRPSIGFGGTLAQATTQAGFRTALISDDYSVLAHEASEGFQIIESTGLSETTEEGSDSLSDYIEMAKIAPNLESTQLFKEFAALSDLLESLRQTGGSRDDRDSQTGQPFFAWAHFSSLGNRWDAPEKYRSMYTSDGDLPPLESAIAPCQPLVPDAEGNIDPDQKLQLSQTYGAQLSVWETCLEALLDYMEETGLKENTLLLVLSTRGIGLGEHGQVGLADPTFHTEYCRLSGFIRSPRSGWELRRTRALVSFDDIQDALRQIMGTVPESSDGFAPDWLEKTNGVARDRILGRAGNLGLIQTPAWRYLYPVDNPAQGRLYALPDDRWEINDIADICPEIIEKVLQQQNSPQLADVLTSIWR